MATMEDVAARAGVSVATVSRALSGTGKRVSPAVRDRVARAAEELGYQVNRLASNMRTGTARTFGLVISDVTNPFFTAIARSCEDVAQRHGYSLVLSNTDEDEQREATSLEVMAAERVAGIVVASTNRNTDVIRRVAALGIPIVAIDRRIEGVHADMVMVDNDTAAYEAVSHLIGHGHDRIAMITGPEALSSFCERLAGYRRALRAHGLPDTPDLVRTGNLRESGGYRGTLDLLDAADPPTAIFAANNMSALGALRAIRERGLRVPDDISLVGIDDFPGADLLDPPLTVVCQPTVQVGARAAELLLRRAGEPDAPIQEVLLAGRLVVRGSTGPAPRRPGPAGTPTARLAGERS